MFFIVCHVYIGIMHVVIVKTNNKQVSYHIYTLFISPNMLFISVLIITHQFAIPPRLPLALSLLVLLVG